jgi:hypothetical protein
VDLKLMQQLLVRSDPSQVARGDTVILAEKDSNDSKITL